MKKSDIITKIMNNPANLIWEIDSPEYYQFIGWNGGNDNSYWLFENLEAATNNLLKELLAKLSTYE